MDYSVVAGNTSVPVRNIYCVGRNYILHAKELGNTVPETPMFFQKALTSLTTSDVIELPEDGVIHYELEVVALIATSGYKIPIAEAWDHVGGLALGLDLTDRPLQSRLKAQQRPWFMAKSFKDAAVVADFKPLDLEKWAQPFWLKVNDVIVQEGRMRDMVFPIPALVNNLSERIPLLKGDLIYTGTPEGVGELKKGDRLELGLGAEIMKVLTVKE